MGLQGVHLVNVFYFLPIKVKITLGLLIRGKFLLDTTAHLVNTFSTRGRKQASKISKDDSLNILLPMPPIPILILHRLNSIDLASLISFPMKKRGVLIPLFQPYSLAPLPPSNLILLKKVSMLPFKDPDCSNVC